VARYTEQFIHALQLRAARSAIGPSTARGRGNTGVVSRGREYLGQLDLRRFGTSQPKRFRNALDEATDGLRGSFPRTARHWGLARKGLNIFLRDCLYTSYLSDVYSLQLAEPYYEVPLDSLTGRALYTEADGALPRWRTIRDLSKMVSDQFQEVAARVAAERRIHRVHLDAFWWGVRQTNEDS
jgi:hypothetical protein